MSIGSVIKSVQNVANKLLGNNKPATSSYQIPKPVATPILKPLQQITAQPLQQLPYANGSNWAQINAILNSNSAKMNQTKAQMAANQAILDANARAMAAAAAEKERRRKETEASFNKWKDANKSTLQKQADKSKSQTGNKEFDVAYEDAYKKALEDFNKQKEAGKKNLGQKLWDKVSFGQDRRDQEARRYAERKAQEVATKSVADYDKKLQKFLKEQAKRKADIENAKFGSREEFNSAVAGYTHWESQNIGSLETDRAAITAKLEAYGSAAESKLTSATAKSLGWVNRNVVQGAPGKVTGGIWNYTLGQGSKNVPSIVTTPSRIVNWIGNLNTKDRDIYQSGGTQIKRTNSNLNAWQAGYNQRNFNIRPVVDKPYDKNTAWKELSSGKPNSASIQQMGYTQQFKRAKSDSEKESIAKKYWDERNRALRNQNSLQELAADPLNLLAGAGSIAKGLGVADKASEVGRAGKATSWIFKGVDTLSSAKSTALQKLAQSKAVKWLGAEHKTPEQKLADAIDAAKKTQGVSQANIIDRVNQINKKLAAGARLDTSVFDDFSRLTDSEAAMLQRMKAGKLSLRDRGMLAGKNYAPIREKLETLAKKWEDFSEQMRQADQVKTSRFGLGKKTYSPRTVWTQGDLKKYNFRLKSKGLTQTQADFRQGAIDRYFKSSLDDEFAGAQKLKRTKLSAERKLLLDKYDSEVQPAREAVEKAYKATKSPWNKARKVITAPTRLWKQSVLKFRPAWYVNNELYNTQAAVLAGGGKALTEKAKLLNPRYWRKALDEVPSEVKTDLANEIGKGRLSRFAQRQENWSRVAAYRAAKAKGLSDADALKRVDKYLLSYKTKNWEAPIKSVIPFWSFQKGVAKAAVQMPFDRPIAAQAYNRLDRYQKGAFDKEFEQIVPQLTKLGYSEDEIQKIKDENAKYFKGRLKVGNKWITTPFNAFSERGLSQFGFNPYLAAGGETAEAVDSFGQPIKGNKASLWQRLISKFPQADLVNQKLSKPTREGWIGKPGSEGYGLSKEKQGFDKSKASYSSKLDPQAKFNQNLAAFAGVPRSMEFNKDELVRNKTLEKATADYFSKDWKNMDYPEVEKQQKAIFEKYGLTADDFYKGVLARYDTETTKQIKGQKEAAAKANKSLFEEYAAQPVGTRNQWATKKLAQLVKSGYFDTNPFLKSFKWITPDTVASADRATAYREAKASGDWSKWRAKYGDTRSEKAKLVERALKSGDWSAYRAKYGSKTTPYTYNGKYFKTAASRDKYIDGEFWTKYYNASADERKQLLKDNPKYNTRANWTKAQWDEWKNQRKDKIKGFGNVAEMIASARVGNNQKATTFLARAGKKQKKVVWRLQS